MEEHSQRYARACVQSYGRNECYLDTYVECGTDDARYLCSMSARQLGWCVGRQARLMPDLLPRNCNSIVTKQYK
jgi:hypothetical protein